MFPFFNSILQYFKWTNPQTFQQLELSAVKTLVEVRAEKGIPTLLKAKRQQMQRQKVAQKYDDLIWWPGSTALNKQRHAFFLSLSLSLSPFLSFWLVCLSCFYLWHQIVHVGLSWSFCASFSSILILLHFPILLQACIITWYPEMLGIPVAGGCAFI